MPQPPDEMVLMTVQGHDGAPSLAAAAEQLGVQAQDLDPSYGVVIVDPSRGLYSVLARADRLPESSSGSGEFRGPYANPRIVPFGPVRPAEPADPRRPELPE